MNAATRWSVFGLLGLSVLILAFAVGYLVRDASTDTESSRQVSETPSGDDGGANEDFGTLNDILDTLEDRYVDPDRVDRETLYQAAIAGMLETLSDTGTFYVDPNTVATSIGPSGTFEGIGATVAEQEGQIVIVAPIEDTPAERAGLAAGDIILEVNGESTQGWTQEKAVIKIRGPRGTTVTLLVRHGDDGSEETLEIERDEIRVESVTTLPPGGALRDGAGSEVPEIGYILIREFGDRTRDEVNDALNTFESEGKTAVILDLRNNPGGLLRTTVDVADEFLDSGVILTERERDGSESSFEARGGGAATEIPIVVLMNRFSASGSEVLAAALQDNERATVVGETSFGKGTVNIANDLDDGGQLYVTIARWLTPDGTLIDGVGVRPDVEISLSDEDIDLRRDTQLFKAIDVLRGTNTTPLTSTTPVADGTSAATVTPGG